MPHALIAGATKSGKSVCINTLLVSLLIKNSPDKLKLILVDPKMVEMTFYRDIPHLAVPVITDLTLAGEALKWACEEMDRRYEIFSKNRVRNLEEYNKKRKDYPELENLPFILAVIDEFNDLVMQCGAEVNDSIVRLAQKARACGMHIILATQRPTVQVVSGTIKANIPCRIAFRVASQIDSNTILDEVGAENLLGRGDMLIKTRVHHYVHRVHTYQIMKLSLFVII
jgi:S-DNA-T family DNA segregation ATPase FtsK/SpoIIIE